MMDGIITYIRSWFPVPINEFTRKRRAPDSCSQFGSPKYRKILSPINGDDWLPSNFRTMKSSRRPTIHSSRNAIVVLDDDDSGQAHSSKSINKRKDKFTSTPVENAKLPSPTTDDVTFVKAIKSSTDKKSDAKTKGFTYISRIPSGTKPKVSIGQSRSRSSLNSPSLDYSIRLDDHRKYKELLENLSNNSSIYRTPVGKLYDYDICNRSNRGRKLVNMVTTPKSKVEIVDLTHDTKHTKPKLSVTNTVIKILDDFDNKHDEEAPVEIQDSDSDVEILPTPPSPKPDIKVDPVNSLKAVIDLSETTKPKWLKNVYENHERYLEEKIRQIETLSSNSSTLNEVNHKLLLKSLERRVHESLAIKDIILPEEEDEIELPPLSDEHMRRVREGFSGNPNEVLSTKFSLNVTRRDLQTLANLNWLNDNVINFYMNLLIERGKNPKWPRVYAMNTFFYQKLISSGPESLRRWTRRVDIFEHEIICVPIHLGMHWCMAIVNLKEKTIKYYDSMGKDNDQCLEALAKYLEYEHMDKKKESFSTDDFTLENVDNIPHQMNGSDCGMFSCTFAEFATRRAKFTFGQSDMPYLRKKMVVEILTGQLLIE